MLAMPSFRLRMPNMDLLLMIWAFCLSSWAVPER